MRKFINKFGQPPKIHLTDTFVQECIYASVIFRTTVYGKCLSLKNWG